MRSLIRRWYRRFRRVRGGSALAAALTELPPEAHEPLRYLHSRTLEATDEARCNAVERIRERLAARGDTVDVLYSPKPGSAGTDHSADARPEHGQRMAIEFHRIAYKTSIPRYLGRFLYLAAKSSGAISVLELGSCAGLSAAYLASSPGVEQLVTVEGSPELAAIARETLAEVHPQARVIASLFDEALDELMPGYPVDLAWIDGHHERTATLHYFERIAPALRPGAWVLFDDIAWSADMASAWEALSTWPGVSHAIHLGRCGMVIWGPTDTPARAFDLRAVTGTGRRPGTPDGWRAS
jgi:predicted O-methyltransferase YrrM